jgi:hypothetical protein
LRKACASAGAGLDLGLDVQQELAHRGVAVALAHDVERLQQRHARLHHHASWRVKSVMSLSVIFDPPRMDTLPLDLGDLDALAAQRRR